MKITALQ